ncbi:MAG TPA: hypothetical protein VFI02_05795 [Armatimonadota bacterium]|nr:hypothetical protein [Armatimonadota bacterium]
MNEQAKHTATPWSRSGLSIYVDTGSGIIHIGNANTEETAAYIVKACNEYEGLRKAVEAGGCPCWVHNAAITDDIEALRSIALWYANWNNSTRMPALAEEE